MTCCSRNFKKGFQTLVAVGLALALSACSSLVVRDEGVPDHFYRKKVSPQFLLESLQNRRPIDNLKSFVRTSVTHHGKKNSFRQVLIVGPGQSLRLDTMDLFGRTLGVFIHQEDRAMLYDPGKNEVFRDAEVWEVLDRIIGATVNFEDLIDAVSGNIPNLHTHTATAAGLDRGRKFYRLETTGAGEDYVIALDAYTLQPMSWDRVQDDNLVYRVVWSDYQLVNGREFPHKIEIHRTHQDEQLTLKFKQPAINQGLSEDAFKLPLPGIDLSSPQPSS